MSREPSLADGHDAASESTRSKTSSRGSSKPSPESTPDPVPRHVPMFEPIPVEEAKARAAVEQWRTFSMILEPQPNSHEAATAFIQLIQLAEKENVSGEGRTRFTVVTKESLAEVAKQNGIAGKRALAQAMLWIMTRDKEEGLADKRKRAMEAKHKPCRDEDDESASINGDDELDPRALSPAGNEEEAADQRKLEADDGKQEIENDDEVELEAIARKQAERDQVQLELRAARLFTTLDDKLAVPDRVYLLKGFPGTDADAAQFLEENHAYFTGPPAKKKKEAAYQCNGKIDGKLDFLSVLDAVVQLTTKELCGPPSTDAPRHNAKRSEFRPGTASSRGSTRDASPPRSNISDGEGEDAKAAHRKRDSVWDRTRSTSASTFTHASGLTKALALAQTKGGTIWQDLSFCYVNVIAPEDPNTKVQTASENGSGGAAGKTKVMKEIKNILELTKDFTEIVTQMAFEKFDFHQWFSTAEVITLPRKEKELYLARAVVEAKAAAIGPADGDSCCAGGSFHGSAARIEGSLWASDPALLTYADLMLAVPEELTSVATALHCMIEAVMLKCTGTIPQPLKTSPPSPIVSRSDLKSTNESVESSLASSGDIATPAPIAGGSLPLAISTDVGPFKGDILLNPAGPKAHVADEADISTIASRTGGSVLLPPPPPRNFVLEFGDYVGKRVAHGVLNRAVANSADRVDPRAVITVERSAVSKLQNPRLVGHGALPREPLMSEKDRGTERCELLTFTGLGEKDVDRTRQIWALERLVNATHPPPGKNGAWSFVNRRYWDVLPSHVVPQVLREENGTAPRCLRQYYNPTDELLVALHHITPAGRGSLSAWDPSTSGTIPFKFRPAFKDWAKLALPKDSSYTPRTLAALGAIMDVSKADLDRAQTKSVKVFPADHSLVVLSGFVATGERWLSAFNHGHVMGLHLTEHDQVASRAGTPDGLVKGTKRESQGTDPWRNGSSVQGKFAARFTMGFDDDSRVVVSQGTSAATSPPPTASKGTRKSLTPSSASPPRPKSDRRGRVGGAAGKPDGYGTVSCVHTFPTGLAVTTGSDGTVRMEFVLDAVRDRKQRVVKGFAPEAGKDELARAIVGRGTVVRYMRDGSTQILFVTGDVVIRRGGEETLFDKHGTSYRRASAVSEDDNPSILSSSLAPNSAYMFPGSGQRWIPVSPYVREKLEASPGSDTKYNLSRDKSAASQPEVATATRDVETGAVVSCPPGDTGRATVVYQDGVTLTRHVDGTMQRWTRGAGDEGSTAAGLVLVECAGFASVEVDVEIQEMCTKHSKGKPVTITRGGNRVRLRVAMPNGGATLATYDTRVTSEVCGRVVYVHPDNTEVIASDKGEVIVRPRSLWEGRPVHDVLAGPNSSMPPNEAQSDLLVGTYRFDCLQGVMETEDADRNRFVLDVTKTAFLKEGFSIPTVRTSTEGGASRPSSPMKRASKGKRPSSRPSSGKGDGVLIDLAGETAGVCSAALVTNPLEPRLFVYRRDGSALELLRNDDAERWCREMSSHPSMLHQQQQGHPPDGKRSKKGGVERTERATTDFPSITIKEQCCTDPHSRGSRQLSFYVQLSPIPKGEGSLAALLERGAGRIFGDKYCGDVDREGGRCWRTRRIPLCARALTERGTEGQQTGSTVVETCIRRVWVEHPPLPEEDAEELRRALAEWGAWRRTRVEQIDRFSVTDPRPDFEKDAQASVQKLVRKAFREAKALRQKQKEKARAARALAAKEQAMRKCGSGDGELQPVDSHGATLPTSSGSRGESTMGISTFGGDVDDDDGEDDMDFPDSGDEEEDSEITLLREEAASAYASAGGESKGFLDIPSLRLALITVLGRTVKQHDAEGALLELRERTFPGQNKASTTDLFHILNTAGGQEAGHSHLSNSNRIESPAEDSCQHQSNDQCRDGNIPSRATEAPELDEASPHRVTSTSTTSPPRAPEPPPFWDTPLGRSLGHTSAVMGSLGADQEESTGVNAARDEGRSHDDGASRSPVDRDAAGADCDTSMAMPEAVATEPAHTVAATVRNAVTSDSENACAHDSPGILKNKPRDTELIETPLPEPLLAEHNDKPPGKSEDDDANRHIDLQTPERWINPVERRDPNEARTQVRNSTVFNAVGVELSTRDDGGHQCVMGSISGTPAQGMGTQAVRTLAPVSGSRGFIVEDGSAVVDGVWGELGQGLAKRGFGRNESSAFEVHPQNASLGRIELGQTYPIKLQLANVGGQPGRFRVAGRLGGTGVDTGCVKVGPYPKGKVAAGLAVSVPLRLIAGRLGALEEVVSFVAEDGCLHVIITAEVVEANRKLEDDTVDER